MRALANTLSADERPKAAASVGFTDDAFLDGRIRVWQPVRGFRAGLDSVMLAAAVPAKPRDRVCDLGAGVGTASLCLAARVQNVAVTAIEIDADLAELSRANAHKNEIDHFDAVVADVLKRPRTIARQSFDHVMTNPPYHDTARGTRAPAAAKARATSSSSRELIEWLRFAKAIAKPKGMVTAIVPPEQLTQSLTALSPEGLGVEVIPLWPKEGEGAKRIIVRTRLNARAGLRILPGIVLHKADGTPTAEAQAVLRRGDALTT